MQSKFNRYFVGPLDIIERGSFKMAVHDLKVLTINVQRTNYDAVANTSSHDFARIVKNLATLADSVVIEISNDALQFSISGIGSSENPIPPTSGSIRVLSAHRVENGSLKGAFLNARCVVRARFSLRHLVTISRNTLSPRVELKMQAGCLLLVSLRLYFSIQLLTVKQVRYALALDYGTIDYHLVAIL